MLLCLLGLCGCTKREELFALTEETAVQADVSMDGAAGTETDGAVSASAGGAVGKETDTMPGQQAGAGANGASWQPEGVTGQSAQAGQAETAQAVSQTIFVHVCGAVQNPGVYEMEAGSRVYEAVLAAGGFAEDADESYVNQAQELPDGAKLVIPTLEEAGMLAGKGNAAVGKDAGNDAALTAEGSMVQAGIILPNSVETLGAEQSVTQGESSVGNGKININTASEAELCNIPGIGATRAAAIAQYRQEHGGFSGIEDIMKVNGIKEGTFEKIKDSITVN